MRLIRSLQSMFKRRPAAVGVTGPGIPSAEAFGGGGGTAAPVGRGVRVLAWKPAPGRPLPDPVIADDSDLFKPEQVKSVRAWLAQTAPAFQFDKPTDTTIQGRDAVEYCVGNGITEEVVRFRHCTIEVCLRDKKHAPIIARYRFVAARAMPDQRRVIVGPCLGLAQDQQIVLAAGSRAVN